MSMKTRLQTAGYSIVEVLVAVTVLLISIVGPLTIAYKGIENATLAREQNIAFFLAQEGIESIIKKRNDGILAHEANNSVGTWDWTDEISANNCSDSVACAVDLTGNATGDKWGLFRCNNPPSANWSCDLYTGSYLGTDVYTHYKTSATTPYHREIYLGVSYPYVHVVSEVTWKSTNSQDQSVKLETYIYDIYGNI